ncbi:MAG TPA: penicillin-binding protein 2 [Candidatus Paceibacterota bacterium]|nr:penicillin-binding protein 2 [Candidatus Paceibacterota bacterium]
MASNHISKSFHTRTTIVLVLAVFLPVLIIVSRLFYLQIIKGNYYSKLVLDKNYAAIKIKPERGAIYFEDHINNDLAPVATNKVYYTLYLDPSSIDANHQEDLIKSLKTYFPTLEETKIREGLTKTKSKYYPLITRIDDYDLVTRLQKAPIAGVGFAKNSIRYYPFGTLASQVIGFLQTDNDTDNLVGVYGLEKYYNDILEGSSGTFEGAISGIGTLIRSLSSKEQAVVPGSSIIATIDKNVQFKTEQELQNMVEQKEAASGIAIIMEADTGKILAMANYPTFNPNEYSKVNDYSLYRNNAVESRYELGSVVKILTMAAGLNAGKIKETSTYNDNHKVTLNNKTIGNYEGHLYGLVDMKEVLAKSINMGAVYIEQQLGGSALRDYFKKFGLDSKTGIDLPNEAEGSLKNIDRQEAREIDFATASYGQGIATTPIEMVMAASAITNNGKMVNPYILEGIKKPDGTIESTHMDSETSDTIISPETAAKVKAMMVYTVENGYGKRAKVKGYKSGGKTGTAMMFINGEYSNTDNIHSYIGFFPVEKPKYIIYTVLTKPMVGLSAESTATILWHNLSAYLISYYNIPPDDMTH